MVGREYELEAGARFFAALDRGSGCLVLEGEAGIGKTTVWEEIVAQADARGCRSLSCRPAEAEASLSFAALADLLSGVDRGVLAGVPDPQRHALEVAMLEVEPGPQPLQPRAVFAGFCSVLLKLAEDSAVLVAVDDLQWLDQPSQAALEFALRRLGRRPIGFLCSLRVGESPRLTEGLARAFQEFGSERVPIGPLSVGALHDVVVAKLGRSLPRPVLVRLAGAVNGNPFYVLELAREMEHRGAGSPTDVLPVPDDLSELVAARVRRLPRETQDALLVAAALSSRRLELLDREALEPAVQAGLIEVRSGQVWFSHPLFAAAVLGSASIPERRAVHRRLAPVVDDREQRVRHLAFGAEEASEEIALELERAAQRSVARGTPGTAAELLELAVGLTPSGSAQKPVRALGAAGCHFHAGDRARARSLAEQVLADTPSDPVHGQALQLLGEVRYHEDSFGEAISLFEDALARLGDDPRAVELHVNLAFAHWNRGELSQAAAHGNAAVKAATSVEAGGTAFAAAALAVSALAEFYLDRPLDHARIASALALEDRNQQAVMVMRPSVIAALVEFLSDNFDRARALFVDLRERTLERGEDSSLPHVATYLSMLERTCGNLRQALEFANEANDIARTLDSEIGQALALAERCFVRATLGEIEGAREDAARVMGMAQHSEVGYAAAYVRSAVAFLELSIGDARAASESLEPHVAIIERAGQCNPTSASFALPDEIEALVALGALARADELTLMLEQHGRKHGRGSVLARASRCRALLSASRGDLTAAHEEIEQALTHDATVPIPVELGRTLLLKGQIERREKKKRAARESFEQALGVFETTGARLWSTRVRTELERTGVRHSHGDALTPTELRVAELASAGLTNKRIANTLFVSAKTVEANLGRVYLKLGIRSRAELGRAMAAQQQADVSPPTAANHL